MRKLFELFLSFFRPVPKDVVNTGYMAEEEASPLDDLNACHNCGSTEDVCPEGVHSDADGLCYKCFAKAEYDYDINDVLDAHDRRVEKQMSDRGDDSFCIR